MHAHTSGLARFIHRNSEIIRLVRIISPPIVGVPRLARWLCGPSLRIGCPLPWRTRSQPMKRPDDQPDQQSGRDPAPVRNER
jgi:hypothetical protein